MKVRLTKTVSFGGQMYLRGSEVEMTETEAQALGSRVVVLERPKARNTAILEAPQTTVVKPRRRRRKK